MNIDKVLTDTIDIKNINDIIEKYKHRTIINSKYVFEKKIGSGSFGSVFMGKNIISEDKVAIKFEGSTVEYPTLLWESKILNHLAGIPGVVKLRYFGTEGNKNIIVMDLYSHTLYEEINRLKQSNILINDKDKDKESISESPKNDLLQIKTNTSSDKENNIIKDNNDYNVMDNVMDNINNEDIIKEHDELCNESYPKYTKDVTEHLISILQIISKVHDAGVVHRDIKPENFMFNIEIKKDGCIEKKINIIDFGLSRFYMKGDKHVTNTYNKSIVGTLRYISRYVHEGNVYSRRDDIISIIYVAIYLIKGKLPWSGLIISKEEKRKKEELIYDKKIKTTSDVLCKGLPYLYKKLIDYAYKLDYDEKPDYLYMIRQCKNMLKEIK